MKVIYDKKYRFPEFDHVFPTSKYWRLYDRIQSDYEVQVDVRTPFFPTKEDLLFTHSESYLDDLLNCRFTEQTEASEFPLTPELLSGLRLMVGGSMKTFLLAMEFGAAFHIGGGFHHAFSDRAEGFCYFNDIAIGVERLKREGVQNLLILDLDVHQGNGTAKLFQRDPGVFTCSMHQENNYPVKQKGDLDVGLRDALGDEEYLGILETNLQKICSMFSPEFVIYVAGVDVHKEDRLGGLGLTKHGVFERDRAVFEFCFRNGFPVGVVLAGGYSQKVEDTIDLHYGTFRALAGYFEGANSLT